MELSALVEQGAANPFFLLGSALVLGALHGLEPGHSKTLMAAFVIAVRGTASQTKSGCRGSSARNSAYTCDVCTFRIRTAVGLPIGPDQSTRRTPCRTVPVQS